MSSTLRKSEQGQLSAADYIRPLSHEGPIPVLDPADAAAFAEQMDRLGYESGVGVLLVDSKQLSVKSLVGAADHVPSGLFPLERVAGPRVVSDPQSGELIVQSGIMIYEREITPAAGE
jgi:hypothetical protein